jgi:hypothetical protein
LTTVTLPAGESPIKTMALLARVWPALKFSVDVSGAGIPEGKTFRNPPAPGPATVTFTETLAASGGIPQLPMTAKSRDELG